jgi:hypothetical protein
MPSGLMMFNDVNVDSLVSGALYFDRIVVLLPGVSDEATYLDGIPHGPSHLPGACRKLYDGLLAHGVIRQLRLSRADKRRAASSLVNVITESGAELRKFMKFAGAAPVEPLRTCQIWTDLIPDTLRDAVVQEGVGFYKDNRYKQWNWLRTGRSVGHIYYSELLNNLAQDNSAEPVSIHRSPLVGLFGWTEDTVRQVLLQAGGAPPRSNLQNTLSGLLGMASARAVLPRGPETVSADLIVDIRARHRAELTAFQNYLEQISSGAVLSAANGSIDRDALGNVLAIKYEREVRPGMVELQQSLKRRRLSSYWGVISTQAAVPPIAAAAISQLANGSNVATAVATGVGFAFGVGQSVVQAANDMRGLRQASPCSFLLAIRDETVPNAFSRLRRAEPPSQLSHGNSAIPDN